MAYTQRIRGAHKRSGVSRPAREPLDANGRTMRRRKRFRHRGDAVPHRCRAAYVAPLKATAGLAASPAERLRGQHANEVMISHRAFGEFFAFPASRSRQIAQHHRFEFDTMLVLGRRNCRRLGHVSLQSGFASIAKSVGGECERRGAAPDVRSCSPMCLEAAVSMTVVPVALCLELTTPPDWVMRR